MTDQITPPKPAAKKTKGDTGYVVLAHAKALGADTGPSVTWQVVATNLAARSAEHAVRLHAEKTPGQRDTRVLVAVPARSWRPVKVSAKVTTAIVIESADA